MNFAALHFFTKALHKKSLGYIGVSCHGRMDNFSLKVASLVLLGCGSGGLLLAYLIDMHWVSASLMLLLALSINGLVISIEDRPKSIEFDSESDYLTVRSEYRSTLKYQALISFLAVFAFGASIAYFGN